MANKEEHLSPEEKLLRVIQGGGAKPKDAPSGVAGGGAPTAAVTPAPSPAPPPVRAPVEAKAPAAEAKPAVPVPQAAGAPAEKGKLRLSGESKPAPAAAAKPAPGAKATAKPAAAPRPVAATKRVVPVLDFSLRSVNIVLAAIVLIVLLFTGHEILANVRASESTVTVGGIAKPILPERAGDGALPPLEGLLDAVDVRPLFAVVADVNPPAPPTPTLQPHEYCSLLGISLLHDTGEQEAIIKDSKLGKMLYLKVGDAISADGQMWKVKEIQADRVIFTNGNRESVVQ